MSFDSFYKGLNILNAEKDKSYIKSHKEINWDEPYALDFKTAF
jgi:hypothetical protein